MENIFKLKGTDDTPEVLFNRETNEFSITGRSLPEDALVFYKPVIAWMEAYIKQPNPVSELRIALDYFNSSSVKQLLDLISVFGEIIKSGKEAKVIWCFTEGDELMEIKGLEFKTMLSIPFELKVC